ncbi:YegP family protein [Haloferula sp.]|uniref:YegP family protein n=1 Tax=Haloferula sp. TaxID=2497595 RepID=UPI003C71CE21
MAIGYYELKQAVKFSFNLKSANHQVVLASQTYESKAAAENGIASVQQNCGDDSSFERKLSKSDQPYFVLKAANGQVIGQSQMYESAAARDKGIQSVKTNGPSQEIKDLTGV